MRTLKLWVLLAASVIVNSQNNKNADFVVLEAIKGVLKSYFVPLQANMKLIFSGPKSEVLANKLLLEIPIGITFRVIKLEAVSAFKKLQIDDPSIFLYDSNEHFGQGMHKIQWWSYTGIHNHLIYAPAENQNEVIANTSTKNLVAENQNYIIVVNDTTVDLVTSFRFMPGKCNFAQYNTINRFSTDTMKWENETFFPEKYQEFHGCPLRVAHVPGSSTALSKVIFETLANQLNFKYVRVQVANFFGNMSLYDVVELETAQNTVHSERRFVYSSVLYNDYMTFTVPAGEPYTQLEKMFLMFDKATWICTGVTLGTLLLVIQIINLMSIKVQKFVFGRDIRTPTLNLADIFLNGGQNREPGRNFARFMLMFFVIWSLIIRTCYQSELYKNLQTDMRKPIIQSIDELNEQNFTHVYEEGDEVFHEISSKM
jgi:hypothetical protein